jgi:hypothetical protein
MVQEQISPSVLRRELEHKFHLEDVEVENTWRSCCLDVDKRAVKYFSQLGVGLLIIGFCMERLVTLEDDTQAYFGLLTFTVGILLPNPSMADNPKR